MQGLIDSVQKNDYLFQLFLHGDAQTGYWYEVCSVWMPGGKATKRACLETGKAVPEKQKAEADGKAAFARLSQ